jgi:sulfite reductase beta subunit-like hemoprotein
MLRLTPANNLILCNLSKGQGNPVTSGQQQVVSFWQENG